jgi:hypothetical protein
VIAAYWLVLVLTLQCTSSFGTTREGKGRVVEQLSRDMRVFVIGGGSEEILEDLGVRNTVASSSRTAKL